MPSRIIVQSGETEYEHPIEVPVLRVGRGEDCDIRTGCENAAIHMVTIEYRDLGYVIHNRSDTVIRVGNASVAPATSHPWRSGQGVSIGDELRLELEIDGDPAPSLALQQNGELSERFSAEDEWEKQEGYHSDREHAAGDSLQSEPTLSESDEPSGPDSKTLLQMGVIAICFISIAAILVFKTNPSTEADTRQIPSLADLFRASKTSAETWEEQIVSEIQRAETARLRGQRGVAKDRFLLIRDELERSIHRFDRLPEDSDRREFVRSASLFVGDRVYRVTKE